MNFTGPFVLICGMIAAVVGVISAVLMTVYERRHKKDLRSNIFKSVPAFAVLTILVSLVSIPSCMLTFVQRGREIILLERDTDGITQWMYASVLFGMILFLLWIFVRGIARFISEEKKLRQILQGTSECS